MSIETYLQNELLYQVNADYNATRLPLDVYNSFRFRLDMVLDVKNDTEQSTGILQRFKDELESAGFPTKCEREGTEVKFEITKKPNKSLADLTSAINNLVAPEDEIRPSMPF